MTKRLGGTELASRTPSRVHRIHRIESRSQRWKNTSMRKANKIVRRISYVAFTFINSWCRVLS